ncbi:MAG: methyltransferase type 11 [Candidatus Magasanikbacteria bacterium CG11_big_fil_rev_8_21_14_0_20_39_34]|uniref:Methyltransferase type 11 n=1 Tax=Candidatus Magasanikbacteria bacterium CG11_big_fil_rev_8_21_14_0_20_39_34 TaxID=1974653 RepID=A0A2H0N5W7_9BACT|nr:MAG: methyltransferase type 11 [Candidatus Magasanikbacteria bacterium CG11_big_fil_rev_8_21_14_0_20_39_34]
MNYKKEWDELGKLDPLWAVLSHADKRFGGWDNQAFFQTGEEEIKTVIQKIQKLGYPKDKKNVLDFGCGVGRLTRALSKYFEKSFGVDVSGAMIQKAKKLNKQETTISFQVNDRDDLSLFEDNFFDMIYCNIVLQHIPSKTQIKKYISEFIRTLAPGGIAVFQLPSKVPLLHRLQPQRRLYRLLSLFGFSHAFLYNTLKLYPIQMNWLSEKEVRNCVMVSGKMLLVEKDSSAGEKVESRLYFVTK